MSGGEPKEVERIVVPRQGMTPEVEGAPDKNIVFVCGLDNSGTSILHDCLREHPRISGFSATGVPKDEGQHLQTVFPSARHFGGSGEFGFHCEAALDESSPLVTDRNRERLWNEWARHWDLGAALLLEKSPPNLIRCRFLQAMFPNARFVVIERHPVAVSLATRRRKDISISNLFRHWLTCHGIFRNDRKLLNRAMVLKYESLVADPEGQLRAICSFLDLSPAPCPLEVRPDIDRAYFDSWLAMRRRPDGWLRMQMLVARFERRFLDYGYTLRALAGDGLI